MLRAIDGHGNFGARHDTGFRADRHTHQSETTFLFLLPGIGCDGLKIFIEDLVLEICQGLEAGERLVEFRLRIELNTQLLKTGPECVAARVLSQHQAIGVPADILSAHDFVSFPVLEHAVLMDARLVGKRIRTHDCLVGLNREAGNRRDQARRRNNMLGIDPGIDMEQILPGPNRHYDFFQRRITRALSETINGALDLARALGDSGERIGHRQSEIVMAMHRENCLVSVRNPIHDLPDGLAKLLRYRVADGVGNIDGTGASIDRGFNDPAQKVQLRTAGIFAGKLHVTDMIACPFYRPYRLLDDFVRAHLELVLHVNGRGGNKGMNAALLRRLDGFGCTIDIFVERPRQAAHRRFGNRLSDRFYRLEIALTGDGKTSLNDIHPQLLKRLGNAELFRFVHGRTGTLFSVPESGVKDDKVFGGGHG